ncbi:DUF3810 domain-containing protein [Flavobacterium arcticum]|uniref:DUF3810 domain-containing protein n=1 Tax=Flavobacterium arcticum TaxID=1784713 RepID=A0A345HEK9_9FLAO|nr:DUF3810 domain-containing protein [Flavobacterium arcticum]AXG75019.1 DUF3810 domain-containing protein [Flavobacterium arcticum]KAF2506571.1 DUF3810 domain-containing protein [Flavobacterium arcticum]
MKKKKILTLFFIAQIIIVNILSLFPDFVEKYYSNGLYPYIAATSRAIFGIFGFSIGDIIYGIVIIMIIRWLWRKRKTWRKQWKVNLLTVGSGLSIFYFLFYFLWAVNYHRVPLNEKMGIDKKYTPEELISFTKKLIDKTNALQLQIMHNDSLKVVTPYSVEEIYTLSPNGYKELSKQFSYFNFKRESLKSSLISTPLSYMGFGGYLNPFTNEAQVNYNLPLYNLPTTSCHEMSHQLGYASESEANFIGFMTSIKNKDIYFQYSGYSFALKYCLRSIKKIDEDKMESLLPLINKGVLLNFEESDHFREQYQSFIETFFKYFYDNYLKLNHQKDGLETYSKFVGLLVNYYSDKDL